MTIKELKEAIEKYPDNYELVVDCEPGTCDITDIDIDWNWNRVILYI